MIDNRTQVFALTSRRSSKVASTLKRLYNERVRASYSGSVRTPASSPWFWQSFLSSELFDSTVRASGPLRWVVVLLLVIAIGAVIFVLVAPVLAAAP